MPIPEDSIKREWIASGANDLWCTRSTYSPVAYDRLPALPSLDRRFQWLSQLPPRRYECSLDGGDNVCTHYARLDAELRSLGFAFPDEFGLFFGRKDLQAQMPSCTACYLDLPESVTPLPGFPGSYVVRFMNDSQCCVLWYLLFQPGCPVRVLATSCFIERGMFDEMQYESAIDVPMGYEEVLLDSCICADSFGEFIYRFCIENSLWFALRDNLPLAPDEQSYLRAAKRDT